MEKYGSKQSPNTKSHPQTNEQIYPEPTTINPNKFSKIKSRK